MYIRNDLRRKINKMWIHLVEIGVLILVLDPQSWMPGSAYYKKKRIKKCMMMLFQSCHRLLSAIYFTICATRMPTVPGQNIPNTRPGQCQT